MLHGCQLGNRILVGMSAVIMDDVIVDDDVIIGAGAVPPGKRLESGYLYVGSPIEKKRKLNTGSLRSQPVSTKLRRQKATYG